MIKIPIEKLLPIIKKYYRDLRIKKVNLYSFNLKEEIKLVGTVDILTNANDLNHITIKDRDKIDIVPLELLETVNNNDCLTNFSLYSLDIGKQYIHRVILAYKELSIYDLRSLDIVCNSIYKTILKEPGFMEECRELFQLESELAFNEFIKNEYDDLKKLLDQKTILSWNTASSLLNEIKNKTKIY